MADSSAVATAEAYGDLHEYGLSLGVDLEAEGEEDLAWAVQEAFNAPVPGCWTEYADESTGRAFYVKDGSSTSTWEHPMDEVYRGLLALVKDTRTLLPIRPDNHAQREAAVKDHLIAAHRRAQEELTGWSGPYPCEQGEYYHNEVQKSSAWVSPVAEWEQELCVRHAVLSRYLLPEAAAAQDGESGAQGAPLSAAPAPCLASGPDLLRSLRLQLGNLELQREASVGEEHVPEPSTSRSFHTARSATSSRSGRSGRHHHKTKEHKERKEQRATKYSDGSLEEGEEQPPAPHEFNSVD